MESNNSTRPKSVAIIYLVGPVSKFYWLETTFPLVRAAIKLSGNIRCPAVHCENAKLAGWNSLVYMHLSKACWVVTLAWESYGTDSHCAQSLGLVLLGSRFTEGLGA